jgi:hypothetical protein
MLNNILTINYYIVARRKQQQQQQPSLCRNHYEKIQKTDGLKKKQSKRIICSRLSQFEISNMLHISQSTISRDINYMQNKINKKDIDPKDLLFDDYERMTLILDEAVKELGK